MIDRSNFLGLGLLVLTCGVSAQNLIPNPGFEELDTPCLGSTSYSYLADWLPTNCTSGGSFLHPCGTANGEPNSGAPDNLWGGQEAFDGVAYGGTLTYRYLAQFPPQNYLAVPLTTQLVGGTEYCFSLHASLAGRSTYRSQTLSTVFTTYYPTACNGNDTINWTTESQVVFDLSAVDTTNWSVLTGTFTASGGEQYLTIGNFTNFQYSDTVFFGTSPSPSKFAFYYIDGLELRTCEAGVDEYEGASVQVYPNPATGRVTISLPQWSSNIRATFFDQTGRVVRTFALRASTTEIDVSDLVRGAYLLELDDQGAKHTKVLFLE